METTAPAEKTKRSRKSVKRERTGCITCKIRRVKCDGMFKLPWNLEAHFQFHPHFSVSSADTVHRRKTDLPQMPEFWSEM
jgi:hypothetical protein